MNYVVTVPEEIEQLLKRVVATSRRTATSREERNEAIRAARAAGIPFRTIAAAADLTAPAIHKIVSKP